MSQTRGAAAGIRANVGPTETDRSPFLILIFPIILARARGLCAERGCSPPENTLIFHPSQAAASFGADRKEDGMRKALRALVAVLICEGAGIIGSVFTTPSIPGWYAGLTKPPFNPPNWIFGPVWITLYAMMGISAYLVYEKGIRKKEVKKALAVFAIQLVLNALWSIVFFGSHMMFAAIIVILLLWATILASILLFRRISKTAAYLLVPYILWVTFATVLNISLYVLNR
jgi:tryptophan-rich sensory protein